MQVAICLPAAVDDARSSQNVGNHLRRNLSRFRGSAGPEREGATGVELDVGNDSAYVWIVVCKEGKEELESEHMLGCDTQKLLESDTTKHTRQWLEEFRFYSANDGSVADFDEGRSIRRRFYRIQFDVTERE